MVRPKDDKIRKKILKEIAKHPGIKISEIAKNSGISFQVINKILKEPWMIGNFVKSTVNKKEKSNIKSFLTFETINGEDEVSIINRYNDILDIIKEIEEEKKRFYEEIMQEHEDEQRRLEYENDN
jgi:predicted transcriptional regulator